MSKLEYSICAQLLSIGDLQLQDRESVTIRSILNYGGFINRSFQVTDGRCAYHVKLTSGADSLRGLERWRALCVRLSDDYQAPPIRGWIDIPETSFAGPVFDWIEGAQPAAVDGSIRRDAVGVVRRLHADGMLAAELAGMGDAAISGVEAYRSTYHERFVEDLKLVRAQPPPFVPPSLVAWMTAEVGAMVDSVDTSESFAKPAAAATHRDLWLDNLLVTPAGTLYILDWDEMGLGDPMMDWAMLLGPSRSNIRPATADDLPDLPFSVEERERFAIYRRASLLDWIIDPLADWIDAAHQPEHGAAVRENNRHVHEGALSLYRGLYGLPWARPKPRRSPLAARCSRGPGTPKPSGTGR